MSDTMAIRLLSLLMLLVLSCSPSGRDGEEIERIMLAQQEAWNRGSVREFMQPYWPSDSLCFIGRRGVTKGWQATLDNYLMAYPDTSAMGRLQFTNSSVDVLSDDAAYVIGKWELFRSEDTLAGYYSLLWRKMSGKWLIVADHSS